MTDLTATAVGTTSNAGSLIAGSANSGTVSKSTGPTLHVTSQDPASYASERPATAPSRLDTGNEDVAPAPVDVKRSGSFERDVVATLGVFAATGATVGYLLGGAGMAVVGCAAAALVVVAGLVYLGYALSH